MKFVFPSIIVLLGILVAITHRIALDQYLYWKYEWFDLPMHFFGGMLVSLFGVFLYRRFFARQDNLFSDRALTDIIIFTSIVGIFWEIFELVYELRVEDTTLYLQDTAIDFIMNTLGALSGFLLCKKFRKE